METHIKGQGCKIQEDSSTGKELIKRLEFIIC